MKKIETLSIKEIEDIPVWEHWTAENGIEYIAPSTRKEIFEREADLENKGYIVRTHFFLKDMTQHVGFCSPQDSSGIDYIQPVIITERGHVPFYHERPISYSKRLIYLKRLGKAEKQVFPITYKTDVLCDGNYLIETIKDF